MKVFHKNLIPGLYDQKRYDPVVLRLAITEFESAVFLHRDHWFLNPNNPHVQRNNSGTIGIRLYHQKRDYRIPARAIAYFIGNGKLPYTKSINYFSINCGNCDCVNPAHIYLLSYPKDVIYSTRLLKGKKPS